MNRIEFLANLDKYKGEDHSTFLEHYGILGQKWGTRRWQNADGTFNTEGKIRYFGSGKSNNTSEDEKIGGYVADHFHKKIINKSDKNTIKKIKKYPDIYNTEGLSDEEILQAIRRVAKVPNGAAYGRAIRQELYNTQLNKTRSKYYESNAKDISEDNLEDQKIGSSDKKIAKLTKKANNMLNTMYDNMDPETIKKQQDYMNNFSLNVNVNDKRNAKGELLAHPDDSYDELTVDRLNEIRKYYLNHEDKLGSQPGADKAKEEANTELFTKKNENGRSETADKMEDAAKKFREDGDEKLADETEKTAQEMREATTMSTPERKNMTKAEKRELKNATNRAWKAATKGNWVDWLLFGIIGGTIATTISWFDIKSTAKELGIEGKSKTWSASDWDKIAYVLENGKYAFDQINQK